MAEIRSLINFCGTLRWKSERVLIRSLSNFLIPDGGDFSKMAERRRQFAEKYELDELSQPINVFNRQPFVTFLRCATAMDNLFRLSIMAGIDPFEKFDVPEKDWKRWAAGLAVPMHREKIITFFKKELKPTYDPFLVPSDEYLRRCGYLWVDDQDGIISDTTGLGFNPTWRLTQRAGSWPLLRYSTKMKGGRKLVRIYDREIYGGGQFYQLGIKEIKLYHSVSLRYVKRRWELFKDLEKMKSNVKIVDAALKRIKHTEGSSNATSAIL